MVLSADEWVAARTCKFEQPFRPGPSVQYILYATFLTTQLLLKFKASNYMFNF
jgi:hypothetical protein